jgi:hypothetical protein
LNDRVKGFEAELQGKVKLLDMIMNGLINETKQEFLVKPSPLQTRDKLRDYINANIQKPVGKKAFVDKKISQFDIIEMKKISHFTDHRQDYITKSGYKIDNYNLEKPVVKQSLRLN